MPVNYCDFFPYQDGLMRAEAVDLTGLATAVGTPCYVYSAEAIETAYKAYRSALDPLGVRVYFACKANSAQAVLALLSGLGAGMDVVSGGELERALAAGCPADRIVFSGVGKTTAELERAIAAGIHQINVESEPELEAVSAVAARLGRSVDVAIRVNPDVDARTHAKITTGTKENKFGVAFEDAGPLFRTALALPGVRPRALAVHIGSQLLDTGPYRLAFARLADLTRALLADGLPVERLDLGGGLGIPYRSGETEADLPSYAEIIRQTVGPLGLAMMVEPGRSIVGNAGILLSRVLFVKRGAAKTFLVLDAAMNDLIRPSLYDAWHEIMPVRQAPVGAALAEYDVVGPICETGDTLALDRPLPRLAAGDLVAVASAGAYGAVMASTYNARPLPAEVLVKGDRHDVITPRQDIAALIAREHVPDWIGPRSGPRS